MAGGGGHHRKKKLNKEVGSLAIYMHGPQGGPYGNFSDRFWGGGGGGGGGGGVVDSD